MTKILFENELGSFSLFGGSGDINILEIEGLGFGERTFTNVTFNNMPGHKTTKITENARTITISCDVKHDEREKIEHIIRVLSKEVNIYVESDSKKRKIIGNCSSFNDGKKQGKLHRTLTMQFICDNPYFTDFQTTKITSLGTTDRLSDGFMLPMVFTDFTNGGKIQNKGDINVFPVIRVIGYDENDISGILIENKTTKKSILLNTTVSEGEVITIDILKRKISSTKKTDLEMLSTLDIDSYLSDLYFEKGQNDIIITPYGDVQDKIGVTIEFDNQYLEAVIWFPI